MSYPRFVQDGQKTLVSHERWPENIGFTFKNSPTAGNLLIGVLDGELPPGWTRVGRFICRIVQVGDRKTYPFPVSEWGE